MTMIARCLIGLMFFGMLISCGSRKSRSAEAVKEIIARSEDVISKDVEHMNRAERLEWRDLIMELNKSDYEELIRYEVNSLEPGPGINATPPAFYFSSVDRTLKCNTSDPLGDSVSKSFIGGLRYWYFRPEEIEIPLAIHIIRENEGEYSTKDIVKTLGIQLDSLNRGFRDGSVHFGIASIDSTVNRDYFYSYPTDDPKKIIYQQNFERMTSQLNKNDILNVYINGMTGYYGVAAFPWDTTRYRTPLDCIVISYSSLPGEEGMEGNTLVHEMGHFFGLFHTFHDEDNTEACNLPVNNGCKSTGDLVDDTPEQKICHFKGCGKCYGNDSCDNCDDSANDCDTCTDVEKDQVKNYMGYNPDYCMIFFTPLQIERMLEYLHTSRAYLSPTLSFLL